MNGDVVRAWVRGRRPAFPDLVTLVLDRDRVNWQRALALGSARGRVLEIGIGSALNLDQYSGAVEHVVGIDPDPPDRSALARDPSAATFPVEITEMSVEDLDFPDASFDTVVSTFTLCSVTDAAAGLVQVARVLRPGGSFLFLEHGASAPGLGRRLQDTVNPVWRRLANGCNLNRDIAALVDASPLELGPVTAVGDVFHPVRLPVFRGVATRAA